MRMDRGITYQKIRKGSKGKYALAESYYSIMSVMNGMGMTEREVQLVAYTAIRGNITYGNVRDEFCRRHSSSGATINNMVSRLKKLGVFIKENGKVKVNPKLVLNFDNDIVLQIKLEDNGEA